MKEKLFKLIDEIEDIYSRIWMGLSIQGEIDSWGWVNEEEKKIRDEILSTEFSEKDHLLELVKEAFDNMDEIGYLGADINNGKSDLADRSFEGIIKEMRELVEQKFVMEDIKAKLVETKRVVTHVGDDLDNKSATYALEKWAKEQGILKEDESLQVDRVPAGKIKEGMLNVDTGGHRGSRQEDDGTIVIDGNPAEGIKSASEAINNLGIYVPEQIVELADTVPNKVSALDSRSGLALIRYL